MTIWPSLRIIPGLTPVELAALAETLEKASPAASPSKLVAVSMPRRNGLLVAQGRALVGQLTDDDRLLFVLPGKGLHLTDAPLVQGQTGWIFQPKPAAAVEASPVKFVHMPHLNAPAPAPALARSDVVEYLRATAATAPKGAASLKAAATILAGL